MKRQNGWMMVLGTVAVLTLGSALWAADPAPTKITLTDLHCQGCVKKVTAQLVEVKGVAKVQADLETRTLTITPKAQTVLSPRALWDAVEKAKKEPTKLEGPSGTFTAKPKS